MPRPARRASLMQLMLHKIKGPRHVELPVSIYGKLPIYKDFLRHALAGAECQAFKRWLDQGLSQLWASSEERSPHEIAGHAIFLTFPATGKRLLVHLRGSHDAGGLRRFPFTIFVTLPVEKGVPLAQLSALEQLTRQARGLEDRIGAAANVDELFPLIRTTALKLELRDPATPFDWFEGEGLPSLGAFARDLFPEDESGRSLRSLASILKRLRGREGVALRLPTSSLLPKDRQAALWALLLDEGRRHNTPLQLIWSLKPGDRYLDLFRRDIRTDDVFAFHPDLFGYEYITDLRKDLPGLDTLSPLSDEESDLPISSLLEDALASEETES